MCLLDEGVKNQNASHWPRIRHSDQFSHLQTEQPFPQSNTDILGESADSLLRLRMKDDRTHDFNVSNLGHSRGRLRWARDPARIGSRCATSGDLKTI